MSETIEGLGDEFLKWKRAFESKGLKVHHGKTKVMVSSGITLDDLAKSKSCICFAYLEKAFDRVPRKVLEWVMRKKGILKVLVRSVMSLYEGTMTRVRVDSLLSGEFRLNVAMNQGSVLSPVLFAVAVDVVN